jgi:protein FrlC
LIASLQKLCDVAEKEGVDLALEAVMGNLVSELGTTLELFKRFDHPRLKLTFDPSHYVLAGQDVGMAIRRLGPKIRHVHFKDAVGRVGSLGKDFLFPFLGEGNTDWQSFFSALKDIGYDGVLSIEFESFRYMNIILEGDAAEAARTSRFAADKLITRYGS